MKINLGCGKLKMKGFVNVDRNPRVKPDIVADVTITPWKWAKTSQAELIVSDNLFEHIRAEQLNEVIKECHRVLKSGDVLWIRVPVNAPDNFMAVYSDPMHVNYNFTMETYDYYDHRHIRWKNYGSVYGIPKFERIKQERKGRFLIVKLKAIK